MATNHQSFDPASPQQVIVPRYFFFMKYAQLGLAVVILGLDAGAIGLLGVGFDGANYGLFTAIITILSIVYYILAVTVAKSIYNKYAILVLEILQFIWWLAAWATLAWVASVWSAAKAFYEDYSSFTSFYVADVSTVAALFAACAGIGALNWLLFIATMVIYIIHFNRHVAGWNSHHGNNSAHHDTELNTTETKTALVGAGTTSTPAPVYASVAPPQPEYASAAPQHVNVVPVHFPLHIGRRPSEQSSSVSSPQYAPTVPVSHSTQPAPNMSSTQYAPGGPVYHSNVVYEASSPTPVVYEAPTEVHRAAQ